MTSLKKLASRLLHGLALSSALCALPLAAHADAPTGPVNLVVPFPTGGTPDILARILAERLHQELGQPVIVENRAGASGNIGAQYVARAPANGQTLLLCAFSCTVAQSLYQPPPFDIVQDFTPVAMLATVPSVLVVNPQVPANTVAELVALAQAKPGTLSAASSGIGGSAHLALELLKQQADVDILHVPYRGAGQVAADLLGGQVDMYFDNLPASRPHILSGKLRALAVASETRSPVIPNVPTFQEAGYPEMVLTPWFGILAPQGTPAATIETLNATLQRVMAEPAVTTRLTELGLEPAIGTPEALGEFLNTSVKRWGQLIQDKGISNQ